MGKGFKLDGIRWFFPKDWAHIREYQTVQADALALYAKTLPDWVDLPEHQRVAIRAANREYWDDMHAFGRSLGVA